MDFIYLFRILSKRKWIIIGSALLATICAYILTRNDAKKYRSVAQVSTGFTISDEIKVANDNFSFYEADTKFNNAIVTCTSQSVVGLLSYALMLHDLENPRPFTTLTPDQKKIGSLPGHRSTADYQSPAYEIRDHEPAFFHKGRGAADPRIHEAIRV